MNRVDPGDIQVFVQFPGNKILEISTNFWKYVGGDYLRGRFRVKIHENDEHDISNKLSLSNLQVSLILGQPTQFLPP